MITLLAVHDGELSTLYPCWMISLGICISSVLRFYFAKSQTKNITACNIVFPVSWIFSVHVYHSAGIPKCFDQANGSLYGIFK